MLRMINFDADGWTATYDSSVTLHTMSHRAQAITTRTIINLWTIYNVSDLVTPDE